MSASQAYLVHGVPKSLIHHLCINNFHFPDEYKDTLAHYQVLHWSSYHVFKQIVNGTIKTGIDEYLVIWDDCTPYTARKCEKLKLSFRITKPEFGIPNYVVIRRGN